MSENSTAAILWVVTGAVWLTAWRACARIGIRIGATLQRDATIATTRRFYLTPASLLADVSIPRTGWVAMILMATLVPLVYATSTPTLNPIETWWNIAAGTGIAGALTCACEGARTGWRRQATLGTGRSRD